MPNFRMSDVITATSRVFYPNWLCWAFFTEGWGLFFSEELYNLSVLFSAALLWQYLVGGVSVTGLLWSALWVVAVRRYLAGGLCTSTARLTGQTVVITGANVGIGRETARDLLRRGAHVILACRSLPKAEEARRSLLGEGGKVEVRLLDLSSLQSVRDFAAGLVRDNVKVHILINNAGVMMCPYMETQEGFEMQMGTNHLGHFLLTNLLLPQMKQHGEPARIINVSSLGHLNGEIDMDDLFFKKKPYDKVQAYANSKLANVLFTRRLAHLLKGTQIQVFSLHPGAVHSALGRHMVSSVLNDYVLCLAQKTTMEGAQTTVYCATQAKQHSEMYFSDCAVGWALYASKDERLAEDFWKLSAQLVKLDE